MKLYIVLLLVFLIGVNVNCRKAAKNVKKSEDKKKANKTGNNTVMGGKPSTGIGQVPPVKVIPFGPPAKYVDPVINSIGEIVSKNVTLNAFPFTVTRCDQIVLFPCQYINDEDDYRVRRNGYVSITAHYTNLYAAQDGQKLIQQVLATAMTNVPSLLQGARGCVRVTGDVTQKNLNICLDSLTNVKNILGVYNAFSRCRMGDPLTEWDPDMIRELLKLCGISKSKIQKTRNDEAKNQKDAENGVTTKTTVKVVNGKIVDPKDQDKKNKKSPHSKSVKKKDEPKFFLPSDIDNEWEEDRLKYFQPSKLRVPGSRFKQIKDGESINKEMKDDKVTENKVEKK